MRLALQYLSQYELSMLFCTLGPNLTQDSQYWNQQVRRCALAFEQGLDRVQHCMRMACPCTIIHSRHALLESYQHPVLGAPVQASRSAEQG